MVRAREIPAGYELNSAVAKALGWERYPDLLGMEVWVDPMTWELGALPRYSVNMAYAWELVQRAREWSAVDLLADPSDDVPMSIASAKTIAFLTYLKVEGQRKAIEAAEYTLRDDYLLHITPEDICRAFLWAEWGEYLEVEDE